MRLLVLLLAALSLMASAMAQETNATNQTSGENATTGGDEPAAPAGPLEIVLETHTAGGGGYFTFAGETAKNPVIRAAPGQEVRVTLRGTDDGVHNFCAGPGKCTPFVQSAGEEQTITFTAPESGTLEYYCQPHKGAGMKSTISVAAAPAGGEGGAGGEEGAITGDTVDLGQYDPACAGKVAPAIVTTGVTGTQTLADYVAKCKDTGGAGEARAKSGADYVIPISWALIGLGIVGVVWVHKYYKP